MRELAVEIQRLGKEYELGSGLFRGRSLYESLTGALGRIAGRRERPAKGGRFWALRDVDLEIAPGEVVGIVGRNGAGKSTLLKILSRITQPTEGRAELRGNLASLLEVGTGFHPELTGRENIFLNGVILGMKRREIERNFDRIVDFAETAEFLDMPVKRYSSGMYVRLAFAVAAHLEADILLVDEVLAVGDAAFQKKCLAKMGEIRGEGRTILFVSHNMTAIHQLCTRAVLLESGRVVAEGEVDGVVGRYLGSSQESASVEWKEERSAPGSERLRLRGVRVLSEGRRSSEPRIDRAVEIEVDFWNGDVDAENICVNIYLSDGLGTTVLSSANTEAASLNKSGWFHRRHERGMFRARCVLPPNVLNNVRYAVSVYLVRLVPFNVEARAENVVRFQVHDTGAMREPGMGGEWHGVVRIPLEWNTELTGRTWE